MGKSDKKVVHVQPNDKSGQNLLPKIHNPPVRKMQTRPVYSGETPAIRNSNTAERLIGIFDEKVTTLYENFMYDGVS